MKTYRPRIHMPFKNTLLALLAACFTLGATVQAQDGFKSIFNGKDLTDWEGQDALWKVENGAIVGTTHPVTLENNTFLIWQGPEVANFHFKAKLKLVGDSNSGIMYRSQQLDGSFVLSGNQLDIHPKPANMGMLYSEKTGRGIIALRGQKAVVPAEVDAKGKSKAKVTGDLGSKPVFKVDQWNEYEVIAVGKRLIHKINGVVTVDVTDRFPGAATKGLLGLQLHKGPPMVITVKDLQLKRLKGKAAQAALKAALAPPSKKQTKADPLEGKAMNENRATPRDRITVKEGFDVELLYSVPGDKKGSWVNLCMDNKGRIIASDQFGGLYRFPVPAAGKTLDPSAIERIPVDIIAANGMLWAFDALYLGVNDYNDSAKSGLYRLTDTNDDDQLDKVEFLRPIPARGDHGVHAVRLSPDGKSLFLITGNNTEPTPHSASRVNTNWGEDHLLPRMPDGRGHNRDRLAPAGIIYQVDPDGKNFEIYSHGYRNIFDADFNADGELFTYDADMEYDFNTPWYRPTRVLHTVSGSDYGWRNGTGKWPEWYADTLPAAVNIGPGSPTGVTFGYGAKFPAKYQKALYILDWSWGKIYAVHLRPDGSSYTGEKEDFVSGAPLPVTDAIINPDDGAMYFTIGGRKVQSGLYRITYKGDEDIAPAKAKTGGQKARNLRRSLEKYHGIVDANAVKNAWPRLNHEDPFIRSAARIAIESQPSRTWMNRALKENDPTRRIQALLALSRIEGIDRFHRVPEDAPVKTTLRGDILSSLLDIDFESLNETDRRALVRTYQIVLNRFGKPGSSLTLQLTAALDQQFPADTIELNRLLCETLVFLQSPTVAKKAIALLKRAPTQEEQLEYARSLRMLTAGWTNALRTDYIEWFRNAANYRGGASFEIFIENIRNEALATLTAKERTDLAEVLNRKVEKKSPTEALTANFMKGRTFQKNWTLEDLAADAEAGMKGRNFENGRTMFAGTACYACHRFQNAGGSTGPDLTGAGGRYSPRDFIDQIINPSKEVNEQFVPIAVEMLDGQTHYGVVVNLSGDKVTLNTDLTNPNQRVNIDRKQVKSLEPSKVSPMPPALLNILTKEEILDLTAYVLSAGNSNDARFSN
jgi:putative heme-binding domain-containing protein